MIKLDRIRTAEEENKGLRGQKRKQRAKELLAFGLSLPTKFEFKSKDFKENYWQVSKPLLKRESFDKCAYCEAIVPAVAHGDVEHFRPKSLYWWLAYCYDNYSFACQLCNQTYKNDNFPISASARMKVPQALPDLMTPAQIEAVAPFLFPDPVNDAEGFPFAEFEQASQAEKAHLIDPYLFNPETFFKWEADEVLKEVTIAARDNSPESQNAYQAAKDYLGLNREELKKLRWMKYKDLLRFKKLLNNPNLTPQDIEDIKDAFRDKTSPQDIFTGMSRYFVRDVWQIDLT
jgi:hypothetical protein